MLPALFIDGGRPFGILVLTGIAFTLTIDLSGLVAWFVFSAGCLFAFYWAFSPKPLYKCQECEAIYVCNGLEDYDPYDAKWR